LSRGMLVTSPAKMKFRPCPSGDCCGTPTFPCAACATGYSPENLTVTVSGVGDNGCVGCSVFNGTFSLGYYINYCIWYVTTGSFCVGTRSGLITASAYFSSVVVQLRYDDDNPSGYYHSATFSLASNDCLNWANESLTFAGEANTFPGEAGQCSLSGASVTLSS